jgi:hypothetical protein
MLLSQKELRPADIVLTNDAGRISRLVLAISTLQTGTALRSHAGLYTGGRLHEALWNGIRARPLSVYDKTDVAVWRLRRLTPQQRANVARRFASLEGQPYGYLKLPLFVADALATFIVGKDVYWFTRLCSITHFKVCSTGIAWAFEKELGAPIFGRPWKCCSPDVIDDWCRQHPDDAELVFSYKCGAAEQVEAITDWAQVLRDLPEIPEKNDETVKLVEEWSKPYYFENKADHWNQSFPWGARPNKVADDLVEVGRIWTLHGYGYYGFFKPSVAEVLRQIPADLLPQVDFFLVRGQDGATIPKGMIK